jgi:hypothetical protein
MIVARSIGNFGILAVTLLLLHAVLFVGCKQQPRPRSLDFSSSNKVAVVLGDATTEYGTGLQHLYFENDGLTTATELETVPCRHLKLDSGEFGFFYFVIDPTFKKVPVRHARIEVEYYDLKPGTLTLEYDASETKTNANPNPRYTEARPKVLLHGTKAWQTATFYVEDATFKNAQNSGADFRLSISPPELYVRRVTVIRAAN